MIATTMPPNLTQFLHARLLGKELRAQLNSWQTSNKELSMEKSPSIATATPTLPPT